MIRLQFFLTNLRHSASGIPVYFLSFTHSLIHSPTLSLPLSPTLSDSLSLPVSLSLSTSIHPTSPTFSLTSLSHSLWFSSLSHFHTTHT